MTCRRVRKRISLYIDGRLPEDVRAGVQRHLDSCADCRAYLTGMERALGTLTILRPQTPPAGGWERLRQRIEEQEAPSRGRQTVPASWWRPVPVAVAAGVLIAAISLVWRGPLDEKVAVAPPSQAPAVTVENIISPPDAAREPETLPADPAASAPASAQTAPPVSVTAQPRPQRVASVRPRPRPSVSPAPAAPPEQEAPSAPETARLEPDPEGYLAPASGLNEALDEPAAELALTSLTPLVAAAEQYMDPVAWVYDISAEDWL
ncbi:MAG: hypothetical protein KatS3mg024_1952 [Armatimonadota bacterium]|nr:MAG: hypothetical protein KatS3mg024_1952 [Armatimonadota bacterium]